MNSEVTMGFLERSTSREARKNRGQYNVSLLKGFPCAKGRNHLQKLKKAMKFKGKKNYSSGIIA